MTEAVRNEPPGGKRGYSLGAFPLEMPASGVMKASDSIRNAFSDISM